MADSAWIDVSVPLTTGMAHWPGDLNPTFTRVAEIGSNSEANVTLCRMTAHTGTHMDAPSHFLKDGKGIDEFPLETGLGPARVIAIPPEAYVITAAHLEGQRIRPGERVLFKTRNSDRRWDDRGFYTDFTALDSSAATFLNDAGILLVGVDYLSVGLYEGDGPETHRILLGAGIWIIEGLNLASIAPGEYDMVCLPLRIQGCDGAPARVALRPA
ncbi:MAG: cyclase family protein [Acidobacteriaceae bacterium]|nr:cyclase family protein [Acidobacteriaceae bacterium]